jgi:hypothetical protein
MLALLEWSESQGVGAEHRQRGGYRAATDWTASTITFATASGAVTIGV